MSAPRAATFPSATRTARTAAMLVVSLALAACVIVADDPRVAPIDASGPWRHAPSDFVFPEGQGPFERVSIERYDVEGDKIGVGYNCRSGAQIALTIFVLPVDGLPEQAAASLDTHFEMERQVIAQHHPGLRVVEDGTLTVAQSEGELSGRRAVYRYSEDFAGRRQGVHSELLLFDEGPWRVKYRITYPQDQPQAAPLARDFVQGFRWRET